MILLRNRRPRVAFTLIELVVVVTILAVTATLVLTRVSGVDNEARFAVSLSNMARTTQAMEAFHVRTGGKYPDGWDSLIEDRGGTALIYDGNGDALVNTGVYTNSGDPWLIPSAITAEERGSLTRVSNNVVSGGPGGVLVTVYDHDPDTDNANLSTDGATAVEIATGDTLAFVNDPGSSANAAALYAAFKVSPSASYRLLALGVGPNCSIVGDAKTGIGEAPIVKDAAPGWENAYQRPIAIFKVFTAAASGRPFAEFVGIVTGYGKSQSALRAYAP